MAPGDCPECGELTVEVRRSDARLSAGCLNCGAEHRCEVADVAPELAEFEASIAPRERRPNFASRVLCWAIFGGHVG